MAFNNDHRIYFGIKNSCSSCRSEIPPDNKELRNLEDNNAKTKCSRTKISEVKGA